MFERRTMPCVPKSIHHWQACRGKTRGAPKRQTPCPNSRSLPRGNASSAASNQSRFQRTAEVFPDAATVGPLSPWEIRSDVPAVGVETKLRDAVVHSLLTGHSRPVNRARDTLDSKRDEASALLRGDSSTPRRFP